MPFFRALTILALLFSLSPALADEIVTADKIISGDEIALHDGRVLRLASVKAASPEAKDFLESAVSGRALVL